MSGLAPELKEEFRKRVLQPEGRIDLAGSGLLISRIGYPDLDEPGFLAQLDALGASLRIATTGLTSCGEIARSMADLLFKEEGFRGNAKDYYDPDNSYLSRVLEKRTGIPITLGLVYMEVGRRAGLDVRGIGMPGHFLIALYQGDERIVFDPFYGGIPLDEKECRRRAAVQHGEALVWNPRFLEPLDERAIIVRLLRNLKGIYAKIGDDLRILQALEWILALDPRPVSELKMRGLLYERLGAYELAMKDLQKYLVLQPSAPDVPLIQSVLKRLKDKPASLH